MSVEINLIPMKEKKDATFRSIVILLVLLIVLALLLSFLFGNHIREGTSDKEEELRHVREDTAELENALQETQDGGMAELEEAEQELDESIVTHSPVLQELVRALPEESMLYSYDYIYPHRIDMTVVLFDMGDTAAYQHRLNEFSWTSDARLDYVEGEEPERLTASDEELNTGGEHEAGAAETSNQLWFEDYLPHYFSSYTIELDTERTNEELRNNEIIDLPLGDEPVIPDINDSQGTFDGATNGELIDDD